MQPKRLNPGALLVACVLACPPAKAALDIGGASLDDSARVAGHSLKLNGAGIGMRFVFNVYAIGLYLPERQSRASEVLDAHDVPRRLAIVTLRDITGQDFASAVMEESASRREPMDSRVAGQMQRLVDAIARGPRGLRKGDVLTMDWVPASGAVIELNRKLLVEPVADPGFYNALLGIWLGDRPTDPALKVKLLGASR